ncbi:hypothetical protein PROFUN_13887 [Planoprotostelium fungivorum]|uniref:Uncharacterized protein n=1 Tax=Planoprotostelium fungivorum TaxID=1890364 RepID=A0A2P6N294_9EUKA|nr:hypothetical protein PROFUN_13887 [Planoprotostelium fungivorum]
MLDQIWVAETPLSRMRKEEEERMQGHKRHGKQCQAAHHTFGKN